MLLVNHIKYLFVLFFSTVGFTLLAQQPSHFILGQEELSGIDIYHILQDNDENYWMATDQGVIKYDGYSFKKIECEGMLSSSVFDLQLDYNNVVYCKNLNGQIFQIKNDTGFLRVQVPDSLMNSEIFYSFDNQNNLIVITKSIFKVTSTNKIEFLSATASHYSQPITLNDSSIFTHNYSTNELYKIKDNKIDRILLEANEKRFVIQSFYLNDKQYYFDKHTGNLLKNHGSYFSINENFQPVINSKEYVRYVSDNEHLWVARQAGGVKVFDKGFSPLFNHKTIFKNNIISAFCKDKEGNMILGTFGEGLIVITNLNLTEINLPNPNSKITRITSTPSNIIFIGTQNGQVYKIDTARQVSLFRNDQYRNIEVLEYINETNELLINNARPTFINLTTGKITSESLGAIKDMTRISNNKYLFASNVGLIYFYANLRQTGETPSIKFIDHFNERTNCVAFDLNTQTIYAGTSLGLKIGNDTTAAYFTLNNKIVICRDILYFEGKVYISTKNDGILIFENNKLIDNWKNHAKAVYLLKEYKGNLFLSTNAGIQIVNQEGKILNTLSKSEGLYSNRIIDFEIRNDVLWLVHQKGVQPINIKNITPFNFTPSISLTQVMVNDSNIGIHLNNDFKHFQNKFKFTVSAKNIRFSNDIKYHYQLVGLEEKWQLNNYYDNKIEYKSLPPGNYIFMIKSVFRNNESKLVSYHFTINQPFWNTWWFYAIITVIFIATTLIIFRIQIRKHRKKIQLQNELNVSKLIAIQSQMNPHFIFNAINSIQDLILKGDIDNSYNYVIKFSKLVRQTLNFSDKEFIDIEDEIELLETYLELEKLRFKENFEYHIHSEGVEDTQVAPMLIQPFVENAIKHGLLHKEGLKKLTLVFKKEDILTCTITDNGIGRKKAAEIKIRQHKNHHSFSVNATSVRFQIMKEHYKENLGIYYNDLTANGESSGTSVIIKIPYKQNY